MLKLSHHLRGGRCGTCRHADERGLTLVEILVALLILAIIIVPISAAMIAGFKVVDLTGSSLQASINRDQASARWAADVAAVDATGVSYSTARACRGNGGGADETLYVTFNNSRLDNSGNTQVRRVSYWITGTDTKTSFVRRSCSGTLNSLSLTNAHEFVVARNMGVRYRSQADTVFPPNGAASKPCDEFSCGANMNGRYYFELRAQRRTFGAGVPLQVGRLYSSAYTRALGASTSGNLDRFRYSHAGLTGNVGSLEPAMGNTVAAQRLSLAPGLEGSPGMKVQFRVQQKTTGKWLTSVAGTYKFDGNNAATWVDGSYDSPTETWYLPMAFGTEAQVGATTGVPTVDAGGEYRVYTQLTESGATAVPKQYGGANGFPLWIDWRPDSVVFVSGTNGNDLNDGRVDAATGLPKPVKTLARALAVAKDNPSTAASNDDQRPEILINSYFNSTPAMPTSAFSGQLKVDTTTAINNATLQGGNTDKWLRAGVDNLIWGRSRLTGSPATTASPATDPPIGLSVSGVTGLRVRQLDIRSGTNVNYANARALSTYGVMVSNSTTPTGVQVELQNLDVSAQAPLSPSSAQAATGRSWKTACQGRIGASENGSQNQGFDPATGTGAAGTYETDCASNGTAAGGAGGSGGFGGGGGGGGSFFGSGGGGASGTTGAGSNAGGGGGGGGGGYCVTPSPGVGSRGSGGQGGAAGTASAGYATAPTSASNGLSPGTGSTGGSGTPGSGGGGSGGGGGTYCAGGATGHQGGAGGHGGGGGGGGAGGIGGGSSIGIYLWNAGIVNVVDASFISAPGASGQPGGTGGNGGPGGPGGTQGKGGNSDGGGGGGGGGGGAGGNGGDGGHSIGVYTNGGTPAGSVCVQVAGSPSCLASTSPTYTIKFSVAGTAAPGGAAGPAGPQLVNGKKGGGAGGSGGLGAAQTIFFFFNYDTASGGNGGQALSDAQAGNAGAVGQRCRVWTGGASCAVN